ncbi:MAG: helix-turn-helix domain-containing protein [Christensenellales bacterium]
MAVENKPFEKRTYTVDEIQDILGISQSFCIQPCKKGLFHYVRIGCTIRISKKSFDEWLDNQL